MTRRSNVQIKRETVPKPLAKPALGDDHPLNDIVGTHEGPIWEDILKNIKRNRKEADRIYWAAEEAEDK